MPASFISIDFSLWQRISKSWTSPGKPTVSVMGTFIFKEELGLVGFACLYGGIPEILLMLFTPLNRGSDLVLEKSVVVL